MLALIPDGSSEGDRGSKQQDAPTNENAKEQTLLDQIKTDIETNKVVVYSKSYCPFCKAAKSLLKESGAEPLIYELD